MNIPETVQPEPKPSNDPIAAAVQELATRGRSRMSVAYAMIDLRLFTDLAEAERAVNRHYPWP